MKELEFFPVETKKTVSKPVKIVESSKKRGKKVSLATKVDDGFIMMLMSEQENIGNFIDLELDTVNNILTLHFERIDKKTQEALEKEMR